MSFEDGLTLFPPSITLQPLNTCQLSVPLREIEHGYIQNYGKVFFYIWLKWMSICPVSEKKIEYLDDMVK